MQSNGVVDVVVHYDAMNSQNFQTKTSYNTRRTRMLCALSNGDKGYALNAFVLNTQGPCSTTCFVLPSFELATALHAHVLLTLLLDKPPYKAEAAIHVIHDAVITCNAIQS